MGDGAAPHALRISEAGPNIRRTTPDRVVSASWWYAPFGRMPSLKDVLVTSIILFFARRA